MANLDALVMMCKGECHSSPSYDSRSPFSRECPPAPLRVWNATSGSSPSDMESCCRDFSGDHQARPQPPRCRRSTGAQHDYAGMRHFQPVRHHLHDRRRSPPHVEHAATASRSLLGVFSEALEDMQQRMGRQRWVYQAAQATTRRGYTMPVPYASGGDMD